MKTLNLEDGTYLHFWWANNKGRGKDNLTIVRTVNKERLKTSKQQKDYGFIATIRASSWKGSIYLSEGTLKRLGIDPRKVKEI